MGVRTALRELRVAQMWHDAVSRRCPGESFMPAAILVGMRILCIPVGQRHMSWSISAHHSVALKTSLVVTDNTEQSVIVNAKSDHGQQSSGLMVLTTATVVAQHAPSTGITAVDPAHH